MTNENIIEKTAKDYSKYINDIELDKKLEPINRSVDDMLTRLEEFETMLSFVQPDAKDSKDILKSIIDYKPEFDGLCEKIDKVEFLTEHIKSNLDMLEAKIEEAETKMGVSDTTSKVTEKVTNIFIPLFKKNVEKKPTVGGGMELFKTEDYFK